MSRRLRKARESLREARNFAMGILIGSAMVTPVFAATDIAIDDLTTPVLVGSLVLLVIGLVLKAKRDRPADKTAARPPQPVAPKGFSEGIGQYRLQLGRGDAD
jgi:hypothetical protein